MLKRIPTDQLRLGMFLHELCGSWMDHPFLRCKFKLQDAADLRRILDCGIKEAWIDTAKGLDVAAGAGLTSDEVHEQVEQALALAISEPVATVSPEQEYRRAAQLCEHARQKVQSLFSEARMGQSLDIEGCLPMVEDIIESVQRNRGALMSLVRLKSADEYTYLHSVSVCTLMVSLARTLRLTSDQVREAGMAGLLHDMGKAKIPLDVLNKPGRLTDTEFDLMKRHPALGHAMLAEGTGVPALALDVCLNHHEKVDGTGYPKGLKADAISLYAKMGAVCDVYDAVTSVRPYKSAWDPGDAVRQMAQWKGHFDQTVFQAFVKTVGIYPTGALVKLQSGRLGVVLTQNEQSLLAPRVKVFFSLKSNLRTVPEIVDLGARGCTDRVVGVESREQWRFSDLDALWTEELTC